MTLSNFGVEKIFEVPSVDVTNVTLDFCEMGSVNQAAAVVAQLERQFPRS